MSVRSRLRDAGSGELWAGQFDQSGIECVVRRVRLAPDPVLRSAAVAAARALAELAHPHINPVVAVLPTAEGLALITEPVVGAISLARLLALRGDLDPGEVVTVGLPVAQALAAAHAVGIVHGRLEREDILLEPNGRPVLTGLGIAALADAARADPLPPEAASADVHDLADLLLGAMREATGPDAAAVAVAVATAMIDDPHRRPSAAELAAALARSATPLPVRLPGDGEPRTAVRPAEPSPTQTLPRIPPAGRTPAAESRPPGARRTPAGPPDPPGSPRRPQPPADAVGVPEPGGHGHGDGDGDGRPRLLAGARLNPGPDGTRDPRDGPGPHDDADQPPPGGRAPGRPTSGATAVDAAELLDSLPPPPRRSTPARRTSRVAGRGAGTTPAAVDRASPVKAPPEASRPATRPSRPAARPSRPAAGAAAGGSRGTHGRTGASAAPGSPPGAAGSSGRAGRAGAGRRPRRTGARRRRWLLPVTAGLGLFAVVVAVVLLMTSPSGDGTSDTAAPAPQPASPPAAGVPGRDPTASPVANQSPEQIWRAVLGALNTARSGAFEHADESLLGQSDAAGSPAYNADVTLMRQVIAQGAHASPLHSEILALQVRDEQPNRTVLRVTERLAAYDYLDARGQLLAHQPAKDPQRHDLVLLRTGSGWRVSESIPVAGN
ncbi:serine/threonine protein kinase [Frankia sp. ACN1ag]|uniref:serine/threonine protein kinase n=1 Tax=Frankia sp. ACN1ag TaxID=102891 RepID=UPI001F315716|nr:serine/threonine protein kinase [Frankia sp. ACN1ag]